MKCRTVKKKLSAYQDGELISQEQGEVACHLAGCRDCREQYAQLEKIRLTLADLTEIRPDPWFCRQVVGKIRVPREQRLLPAFPHVFHVLRGPVLASLTVCIGLMAGAYLGSIATRSDLLPFQNHSIGDSQGALFTTLKYFDPAPPGTFTDGYLRMASYKEDESR